MTARRGPQPDARQALAQRRENGGADEERQNLRGRIEKNVAEFQRAMPQGREAAQLVRDAITCLRTTKKLDQATPESVLGAVMTCAQLGLRPGVLGQAWILPFWDKKAIDLGDGRSRGGMVATLVIGYQGLIDLAMRSGRIDDIIARTVFDGDVFEVDYGLNPKLVHRPAMFRDGYVEDPDVEPQARAYYAVVRYKGGGSAFWVMSRAQAERHARRYSKQQYEGKLTGPWRDQFDEMAMKTTVRMLAKFMPKSPEFASLLQGIQVDEGVRVNYSADATPEETTSRPDGVLDGEAWENATPAESPTDDAPPPQVEEWPDVRQPAGES